MRGYHYVAFCDPSGGRQHDAGDNPPRGRQSRGGCRSREAASFQPGRRRDRVRGDAEELRRRHGSGRPLRRRVAPGERFAAHGVRYEPCERPKSDLYLNLLPTLNAKRVELLDHPRLVSQLCGLERKTARSGKDSIHHAPGARDDLVNSVAGAVALALGHQGVVVTSELLKRVAAMPPTRKYTAWGFRRRAALANMVIPREQQCYPRSVLPAEKFQQREGESR